ncbi:TadE-like protein [Terriglobus roseus DSM 18391]|uniref:TadE-like protein n=1 Tax=Terriglobus roseus (strain DSM 18391 / NRRL B-41598 / KBS 63) TaxID=926566 RepID=I3ZLH3_TERRK|nr:TadE family protein [Terriglobus roseus]AFL90091.1 TadE-like protein [Terriglobus roseus DSM 18391]
MKCSAIHPRGRQRFGLIAQALDLCLRDNAGSGLLEFAFAIGVIMTVILGIVNGSLALYANHYVASAALEGARYAMVRGAGWGGAACATPTSNSCTATSNSVKTFLLSIAPLGVRAANTTVVTTWPGTTAAGTACYTGNGINAAGCSVRVTVTYSFNLGLPVLPKNTLRFTAASTMPITQ